MRFFLLLILPYAAWAQHSDQPAKESSTDLRSQSVLFSIEIPEDKKTILLERTAGMDYFLRRKTKGDEDLVKIASREATRLDRAFASSFLKAQYEIPSAAGKCEVTLRLNLKGEAQDICEKDEKKSREFETLIDDLSKRF